MKRVVLVVGAPRSGTSVVAHVINLLGVNFGDPNKFVDAEHNKHNPIFFELQELNAINDEIFSFFKKRWSDFDWRPLLSDFSESVVSHFEVRIKRFIEAEFGRSAIIGLKDPRFCFTLPVWLTVLERLGYKVDLVFSRRNPNSIFVSNINVNKTFASARNFRITVESILTASYFLNGKPVVHLDYESLITKPLDEIRRICEQIGLDPLLVEHACSAIAPEFNHGPPASQDALFEYFNNVRDINFESADEYKKYREIVFGVTYERDGQIANLNQAVAARDGQIASLNQAVTERDGQIANLNQAVAARDGQIANLNQAVAARDGQITALYNSASWKITQPLRFIDRQVKKILRIFNV